MSASDELRNLITPALPGWRVQFGNWRDDSDTSRYAVLRPVGGLPAALVRRPQFTLTLIGANNDDASVAQAAADAVIEALRASSGTLVYASAGEPSYSPTNDGRAVFTMAIEAIAN